MSSREMPPIPIVYKPEWNAEIEKYVDNCPFEPNRSGTPHICHCRNQEDEFINMTKYKAHIKNKYHTDWVKAYGIYSNKEIDKLTEQIKHLEKENAKLHTDLEKQKARADKYKYKYEREKNKMDVDESRFAECD
jgi:hypothetical protein